MKSSKGSPESGSIVTSFAVRFRAVRVHKPRPAVVPRVEKDGRSDWLQRDSSRARAYIDALSLSQRGRNESGPAIRASECGWWLTVRSRVGQPFRVGQPPVHPHGTGPLAWLTGWRFTGRLTVVRAINGGTADLPWHQAQRPAIDCTRRPLRLCLAGSSGQPEAASTSC